MKDSPAFVCSHVFLRTHPVLLVSHDNGWSFLCGGEHSDKEKVQSISIKDLVGLDPSLEEVTDLPEFWAAERKSKDEPWQKKPLFYKMNEAESEQFVDGCYEHLEKVQENFYTEFEIEKYQSYYYDQAQEIIQFENEDGSALSFSYIGIGSYHAEKQSWMWDWANETTEEEQRAKSEQLRELFYITGNTQFNDPVLLIDEDRVWELAAMSFAHLKAIGMYTIPNDDLQIFIALIEKKN
jgi:hypothetical protein